MAARLSLPGLLPFPFLPLPRTPPGLLPNPPGLEPPPLPPNPPPPPPPRPRPLPRLLPALSALLSLNPSMSAAEVASFCLASRLRPPNPYFELRASRFAPGLRPPAHRRDRSRWAT